MKKKILSLLAAFFMLFGTSAMAQVDSTLEGDVNGDGVVDIADITAVIAIIKQNAEANPTYYWYVGITDPSTMTSISPIVTDNTSPGWRLIGTTIPTYSASNKLFDDSSNRISFGGRLEWYVAIPTKSSAIVRDGLGNDGTQVAICVKQSNVTINGIEYKVFKSDGTERSFSYPIY